MENIDINTTQNISIEQPVASIGERIAAAVIDYAFVGCYIFVILFLTGFLQLSAFLIIALIPVILYHFIAEMAMNGQSWGKKIMKIRVVKMDGTQPNILSYFIRWIFRIIDISMFSGVVALITIIVNGKGQRLGDIAANTTIIRDKSSKLSDTLFIKLPEDYTIRFPEVSSLNEKDIYTIKEVLQHLKKSGKSMEAMRIADKAKAALEKKMGVHSEIRSENFLFTIVRDYNYIHSR